nr:two component sensor kinase [Boldiaceae sp.]
MLKFINNWWKSVTLQFKLIVTGTLLVSLLMSILSYWAISGIRQETLITDNRFVEDLSLLLASNVTPLIKEGEYDNLVNVSKRFYSSTSSIRYIIYLDEEADIYYSIPILRQEELILTSFIKNSILSGLNNHNLIKKIYANTHYVNNTLDITNVFVNLNIDDNLIGFLIIGLNPNPTIIDSSQMATNISLSIFISIWIIIMSGVIFNTLSITEPINELLVGVKNIAMGDFHQRINLPFGGELGELIYNFNEMAQRLEHYKQQNLEKLTAEKAKLEILVARIADGAILLDIDLSIILINDNAKKALGFTSINKISIGEKVDKYLPIEISTKLLTIIKKLTKYTANHKLTDRDMDFCIQSIKFRQKTIRIFLTPVIDYNSYNLRGIVMTIQDITKEVDLNEAKSRFIANVSHELRTPLFNILSFLETLYDYNNTLNQEQKLEFLHIANQETKRLTKLVNNVLDLSRLESDNFYDFVLFDIHILIDQLQRLYQITLKEKNIVCLIELENTVDSVYGNYDLIVQILINLITNAIKFTNSYGIVIIRIFSINYTISLNGFPTIFKDMLRLEVTDTGIGIDSTDETKIFQRFYRVENNIHTLEGTGLGLSIVKNIIEKHNSQIHVSSEVNNGSTFWFDLQLDFS